MEPDVPDTHEIWVPRGNPLSMSGRSFVVLVSRSNRGTNFAVDDRSCKDTRPPARLSTHTTRESSSTAARPITLTSVCTEVCTLVAWPMVIPKDSLTSQKPAWLT